MADLFGAQFDAFGTKAFAHFSKDAICVDELHLAFATVFLVVGDDPDVGRDACVEEEVVGHGDDSLDEIMLEEVTSDLRFA